ncbi:thylakoid lumenal 19 kDa protein, chloroplastic [Argentina anserina]|uniref:thylakoid lumenal 19 kDa protein, chloroplastic n=1 Tax=Argentina anserina TaxID=57926 RepID=UPI0021761F1E|nr:thylakoid lumenal 19 kDa protein, chloroplastic [Potentilla anserina]
MATMFSTTNANTPNTTIPSPKPPQTQLPSRTHLPIPPSKPLLTTLTATAAAAAILTATPPSLADSPAYRVYYGTAASASSYGGYGGNSDKKASAEYVYDVPEGWKERLVSKVEKGTNGTDSEFYNPKKKTEKEYLTYLGGYRQLAPKDVILNNLALSDVNLQDLIASADGVTSEEKTDEKGQVYYVYEINGVAAHSLISVTCANNKLYAHFVNAPTPEWNRDNDMLKHVHESFKTVGNF